MNIRKILILILALPAFSAAVIPATAASAANLDASLLHDLNPGPSGSQAEYFEPFGDRIFTAGRDSDGHEPWSFDATSAIQLGDIAPGPHGSSVSQPTLLNGEV